MKVCWLRLLTQLAVYVMQPVVSKALSKIHGYTSSDKLTMKSAIIDRFMEQNYSPGMKSVSIVFYPVFHEIKNIFLIFFFPI